MSFKQGDKVKIAAGADIMAWWDNTSSLAVTPVPLRGVIEIEVGRDAITAANGQNFVRIDSESRYEPDKCLLFNTDDLIAETEQHGITENPTFEETYGNIIYIDWDEEGEISGGRGESPAAADITIKSEEIAIHVRLEGVPPALDTVVTLNVPGLSGTDYKVINRSYHEKVGEYCYGDIYLMHVT